MSWLGGSALDDDVIPLGESRPVAERPAYLGGSIFDEPVIPTSHRHIKPPRCVSIRVSGDKELDRNDAEQVMAAWSAGSVQEVSFEVCRGTTAEQLLSILAVTLPKLVDFPNLIELHLFAAKLSHPGVRLLAEAVPSLSALRTLNLCGNEMRDDSMMLLAGSLRRHPSLSKLDLSVNRITDHGCESLADALMDSTSVSVLNLVNNYIGDRGARAFFPVLRRPIQTLRRLYIYGSGDDSNMSLYGRITSSTAEVFRKIEEECDFCWKKERMIWIGHTKHGPECFFSASFGMPPDVIRTIMMYADRHAKVLLPPPGALALSSDP